MSPVTCLCLPVDGGLISIYLPRAYVTLLQHPRSVETTSRRFVFTGNSFSDRLRKQSS